MTSDSQRIVTLFLFCCCCFCCCCCLTMKVKPSDVRYSQDSINNHFDRRSSHSRTTIGETLDDICEGRCSIDSIPTITVVKEDGRWISADNRRLWVFRELERLGKCKTITVYEACSIPSRKRTSNNGGTSIAVRGSPGGRCHNKPTVYIPPPTTKPVTSKPTDNHAAGENPTCTSKQPYIVPDTSKPTDNAGENTSLVNTSKQPTIMPVTSKTWDNMGTDSVLKVKSTTIMLPLMCDPFIETTLFPKKAEPFPPKVHQFEVNRHRTLSQEDLFKVPESRPPTIRNSRERIKIAQHSLQKHNQRKYAYRFTPYERDVDSYMYPKTRTSNMAKHYVPYTSRYSAEVSWNRRTKCGIRVPTTCGDPNPAHCPPTQANNRESLSKSRTQSFAPKISKPYQIRPKCLQNMKMFPDFYKSDKISMVDHVNARVSRYTCGVESDHVYTRVSRYTYGVEAWAEFIPGIHPMGKKSSSTEGRDICHGCFSTHIKKGDILEIGKVFETQIYRPALPEEKRLSIKVYRSSYVSPRFVDDDGCSLRGQFDIDLTGFSIYHDKTVEVKMCYSYGLKLAIQATVRGTGEVYTAKIP